jgi:hypothetical protein
VEVKLSDSEYVTPEMCSLHREVINTKLKMLEGVDDAIEGRMLRIEAGIDEIRQLQKNIYYALIGISVGTVLTLLGVILGRGIDFGWLIP